MDIGSVMPMLRQQNGGGNMTVANPTEMSGVREGHFLSEDTYDIPGGKVDSKQETSVQSGPGWHSQAVKKTTVMNQEFSGANVKPSSSE